MQSDAVTPEPQCRYWLRMFAGEIDELLARMRLARKEHPALVDRLGIWVHARWAPPNNASRHTVSGVVAALKRIDEQGAHPWAPGGALMLTSWNDRRAWEARRRWLEPLEPWIKRAGRLVLDLERYPIVGQDPRKPISSHRRQDFLEMDEALEPLAEWLAAVPDLVCYPCGHRDPMYLGVATLLGVDSMADQLPFGLCREIKSREFQTSPDVNQRTADWKAYFREARQFAQTHRRRYLPGIISSILKPGRERDLALLEELIGEPGERLVFVDDREDLLTRQWLTEQPPPLRRRRPK
ncbi:MAG: hypothetical protein K1X74_01760 [Pirellulales bacterium]|nr:hypothetical protein [Pirellulales bacterium]